VGHPRGEHAARQPVVVHARDVAKPATSAGGHSQQAGPNPAALVLARSGGMPRVGALRLAASSAPTRLVPQLAFAARQEEEQGRLAIGPGNRIRPVGVADSSNTRVEVAAPLGAVLQHRTLVAGDGAATAAGILALPDAGPAAFAAASLQLRAQRGQRPSRRCSCRRATSPPTARRSSSGASGVRLQCPALQHRHRYPVTAALAARA